MCVIAGYVGTERAAPILIEMLRREEGLAGAFNTGIATIHEGRLYWDKVVGDVSILERETKAADFPGTIGIIHSRIPGGERSWAHPFIGQSGKLAYIANGALGKYKNMPQLAQRFQELKEQGYSFASEQQEPVTGYDSLDGGKTWVHFSEIQCQSIDAYYRSLEGKVLRLREAIGYSFERYPSEVVGVCLHVRHPDEIVVARHNKPMVLGRDARGGMYLASTAIAFPDAVCWQTRIPAASVASIQRGGELCIRAMSGKNLLPIGSWPSAVRLKEQVFGALCDQGERNMEQMFADAAALWTEDTLTEKEMVVFEMLEALLKEDQIWLQNRERNGVHENSLIPWTWAVMKDRQERA